MHLRIEVTTELANKRLSLLDGRERAGRRHIFKLALKNVKYVKRVCAGVRSELGSGIKEHR